MTNGSSGAGWDAQNNAAAADGNRDNNGMRFDSTEDADGGLA